MTQDMDINTDEGKLAILNMLKVCFNPTAYLIAAGYDDNDNVGERTNLEYNPFYFDRIIAIKLSNNLPSEIATGDSINFSIFRCYGNLEERGKMFEDSGLDNIVKNFTPYITEIPKEVYYGMIEIPIVDVNKE